MSVSIWIILAVIFFVIAAILLIVTAMLFVRLEIASVIGFLTGKTQAKQVQEIRAQSLSNSSKTKSKKYTSLDSSNKFDELISCGADTAERSKMQSIAHASKRLNYTQNTYKEEPVSQLENRAEDRFSKININNSPENDSLSGNKKIVNKSIDEPTGILPENEIYNVNNDIYDDSTSVLSNTTDNESTTLLNKEDVAEETELYGDEEATTKLVENENSADESQHTDILNNYNGDSDETSVLSSEDDLGETSILSDNKEPIKNPKVKLEIIDDETSILTDEVIK